MLILLLLSFSISLLSILLILRKFNAHYHGYDSGKPQRFHVGNVPRIGGIAILLGFSASWMLAAASDLTGIGLSLKLDFLFALTVLASIFPATLGGFYEDLTHRFKARYRLALSAISAFLGCKLLGLSINDVGIPLINNYFSILPWFGIVLAFVIVTGLPHAFNLIDGYNGLAGIVALLICLAIFYVTLQVGDWELAALMISLAGSSIGFLIWNYPRGLIFAGDGGAYLWGTVIAVTSILLIQRHPLISPWFPMLLLIYPIWETIFSIYRKLFKGESPGVADALHFHQLIYRRIVRGVFHDDESRRMLMRNNRTSPYLWGFTLMSVVPAVLFWHNTLALMIFCVIFITCYVLAYMAIIRFKVPRWLRR